MVYDNNSSDKTSDVAKKNRVKVKKVYEKGKGNVVRKMFSDNYEYDYYLMVDGDNTYDLSNVNKMLYHVQNDNFDMVIGKRVHRNSKAYKKRSLY